MTVIMTIQLFHQLKAITPEWNPSMAFYKCKLNHGHLVGVTSYMFCVQRSLGVTRVPLGEGSNYSVPTRLDN